MKAVVVPFGNRFLACRRTFDGVTTVEVDCPTWKSAEAHRILLQKALDDAAAPRPILRRLVHGFYTDEDAQGKLF